MRCVELRNSGVAHRPARSEDPVVGETKTVPFWYLHVKSSICLCCLFVVSVPFLSPAAQSLVKAWGTLSFGNCVRQPLRLQHFKTAALHNGTSASPLCRYPTILKRYVGRQELLVYVKHRLLGPPRRSDSRCIMAAATRCWVAMSRSVSPCDAFSLCPPVNACKLGRMQRFRVVVPEK